MENIDLSKNFILTNNLEQETLIGWSTACLDEAISFYIDCNCSTIITEALYETE